MIETKKILTKITDIYKPPIRDSNSIKLNLNETQFIDETLFNKIISKIDIDKITHYPEYEELMNSLEKYCGTKKDEILVTNGAAQGIDLVLRTFTPKKKVVIVMPNFNHYESAANIEGVTLKKILYTKDFEFPIDKILKQITSSIDGIILCNPSNPIGSLIPDNFIKQILDKAKEHKKFVLIDEVYFEFSKVTYSSYLKKYKNLIILRSFSKGFALAGLRIGYILSSKNNILELEKTKGPWDINSISVLFAIEVLKKKNLIIGKLLKVKNEIIVFLKNRNLKVLDSDTNFITFEIKNSKLFTKKLSSHGILVSELTDYLSSNNLLTNYIRLGIPSEENKEQVLKVFSKVMDSMNIKLK